MGSAIVRSLPSSLEDSDTDTSTQIEGNSNTNTLIRTTPIVNNSFNNTSNKNKNQHKHEGTIHTDSNSWKCSSCGLLNGININHCQACFQQKSSPQNSNNKIWSWKDNNGLYIQYPKSISNELNKLNIGQKYNMKIENTKYEIKKISSTKCEQINIKTKRKRLAIQQSHSQDDDAKIPFEPGAKKSNRKMKQKSNHQKQTHNNSVQSQLLSMGFQQKYIRRALNVYKKNYGTNYNIEVIVEIISRLQTSDERKKNNDNNKNKPVFNNNNWSMNNINLYNPPALQIPLNNMQVNNSKNKHKIIAANVGKGSDMNSKHSIKKTHPPGCDDDGDIVMKNLVIENVDDSKLQNEKQKGNPVHEWTNKQLKDWIYGLNMLSKENINKIISGIEEFKLNAVDFYLCQNGQEIAETFNVKTTVGNIVYTQMHNIQFSENIEQPNAENTYKAKLQKISYKLPAKNIKKSIKRKRLTTWKNKKVNVWNCDETQDWIYSLNIISEDDKKTFIYGIKQSNLTGADFLMCRNGEEIGDSFDGISVQIGNLIFDELTTLSNNLIHSDVRKLFYLTLSETKYKIVEIQKVSTEKDIIYEQILRKKCEKTGIIRSSIEKYLWHGSKSVNNINLICKNGFDRSYNKNSAYGAGTYFAKNAKYSVTKGYCGKDKKGLSYILLCKVIVGDYIVGNSGMKQIPRKSDGKEYESLVNNTLNPTIFVIWRDYHAIPHYLIKYQCAK